MKYVDINNIQNMMINITEEGSKEVWQSIEDFANDPIERIGLRAAYFESLKILGMDKTK